MKDVRYWLKVKLCGDRAMADHEAMSGDEPVRPRVYPAVTPDVLIHVSCAQFLDSSAILLMDTVLYKIHATQSLSATP